uniref:Uncharacterized protein n=1 Tax=Setaria italica TaxID=4555 RepID=K3YNV1_SETIT
MRACWSRPLRPRARPPSSTPAHSSRCRRLQFQQFDLGGFGGTQAAAEMRCGPVLSSEEGQVWYSNQTAVTL